MSGGDDQTFANRELNNYLGGPTLTRPPTVYFQPTSTVPTATVKGTAIAIARPAIPNDSTHWPASSGGVAQNGATIALGSTAGNTYSNMVGWELYDAPTGGNRSFFGTISSVNISDRSAVNIASGTLTITRT